jgi:mgtE-like transporter
MSSSDLGKKTLFNLFMGIFVQAMIALAFDTGGILSGVISNFLMETKKVKWIVLMYGPLLAARGDIAVLAGKLGTGLHLGTVKPTFKNNTDVYKSLLMSVLTIAMLDAVLVGAATYIFNLTTFPAELKTYNPTLFFVIPILVLAVASVISTQITSAVSFFTYKKGLNPDVYVIPVMSTINNILITLIFAGVVAIFKPWGGTILVGGKEYFAPATGNNLLLTYVLGIPLAAASIGAIIYILVKNIKEPEYKKMMKEAAPAVFASGIIGTVTGFTLTQAEPALEKYPQLFIVFPALIGTLVDQNAITANILITDFSAGYIKPELKSAKNPKVWVSYLGIGSGGIVITILLGIIGTLINIRAGISWVILLVILVTVLANVLGYILVGGLMFVLAIVAFRKEIDPDNFAIPLTACLADFACAGFILVFSMLLLGVRLNEPESAAETIRLAVSVFLP